MGTGNRWRQEKGQSSHGGNPRSSGHLGTIPILYLVAILHRLNIMFIVIYLATAVFDAGLWYDMLHETIETHGYWDQLKKKT